jgi:hypothetical protein
MHRLVIGSRSRRRRAALVVLVALCGVGAAPAKAVDESTFFATAFTEYTDSLDTASNGDLWPSCWSDDGNL